MKLCRACPGFATLERRLLSQSVRCRRNLHIARSLSTFSIHVNIAPYFIAIVIRLFLIVNYQINNKFVVLIFDWIILGERTTNIQFDIIIIIDSATFPVAFPYSWQSLSSLAGRQNGKSFLSIPAAGRDGGVRWNLLIQVPNNTVDDDDDDGGGVIS